MSAAHPIELAVVGDVHGRLDRLDGVLDLLRDRRPAAVLLVGDVGLDPPWTETYRRTRRARHDGSVREVIARVRDALGAPVVFVPGNHDLPDPHPDAGGTNCDGRRVDVAGLTVAGLGGAGPARMGFAYEWSDPEADAALARALAGRRVDVLLSHTPPFGTPLDRVHDGRHVGSRSVGTWLERARPRLFVCGHIHEAWGVRTIAGVPCLNAGALGVPFGQILAWTVEWGRDGPAVVRSHRRSRRGVDSTRTWPLGAERPRRDRPGQRGGGSDAPPRRRSSRARTTSG